MSRKIKCIVFDLDGTLWNGTLVENYNVQLKAGVRELIEELDRRGILMSIASKNDFDYAEKKLREEGIFDYFLVPQISWNPKSESIAEISTLLNLSVKEFAFIDDNQTELDEVGFSHSDIMLLKASQLGHILEMEEFCPRFVTEDSRLRRKLYQNDLQRQRDEKDFHGTSEEFLATLKMKLTVSPVTEGDLERVEELTRRTHQLNSTGRTFSFEELSALIHDERYIFLIASLENRSGDCGKVGIALLEKCGGDYVIKLLIMSCRVMTLGVGSALLIHLSHIAERDGKRLVADFVFTDRNRIMYITYKMLGFLDDSEDDAEEILLVYDGERREVPEYFNLIEV